MDRNLADPSLSSAHLAEPLRRPDARYAGLCQGVAPLTNNTPGTLLRREAIDDEPGRRFDEGATVGFEPRTNMGECYAGPAIVIGAM